MLQDVAKVNALKTLKEDNADDNTPYLSGKSVEKVLNGLENVLSNLFQWFPENESKGNANKCYLLTKF